MPVGGSPMERLTERLSDMVVCFRKMFWKQIGILVEFGMTRRRWLVGRVGKDGRTLIQSAKASV